MIGRYVIKDTGTDTRKKEFLKKMKDAYEKTFNSTGTNEMDYYFDIGVIQIHGTSEEGELSLVTEPNKGDWEDQNLEEGLVKKVTSTGFELRRIN